MRDIESAIEIVVLFCLIVPLAGSLLARVLRRCWLKWTWTLLLLPLAVVLLSSAPAPAVVLVGTSVHASRLGRRWHTSALAAGRDIAEQANEQLTITGAIKRTALKRQINKRGWLLGSWLLVGRSDAGFPVGIPVGETSGSHALILGATGSGKTVSQTWIAARLIEHGHGAIVIDPKGDRMLRSELVRLAGATRRAFLEWTPAGPYAYNPYTSGTDSEIADKALAGEVFTEPHYLRQAQRYLGHAVRAMHAANIPVTVPALMNHLYPTRLEATARELPSERAEQLNSYLDSLTERQRRDLAGVRDRLSILAESDVRAWFDPDCAPVIDLRLAVRERAIVYFALDADRRPLLAQMVVAALVSDMVTLAAHLQQKPTPTAVLIDEFSAVAAGQIGRLFGRARSAGMSLLLATQELADLNSTSGLRDQVLGNVETVIAHRQNVPASAETIAKVASSESVWLTSQQTEARSSRYGATERGSRRRDYDYRIHPSRVQQLAAGQALVITPGREQRPTITNMHHPREATNEPSHA